MRFLRPDQYQVLVEQAYQTLRSRLLEVIPYAGVEHVGSSAIRGAISKGDLDVLVRVSKDRFQASLKIVESLGFSVKEGTLRTDALCMLDGPGDVAIQLIESGSEFEMFVRFRDTMNSRPDLVEQYNQLKQSCTGLSPDEYRVRKSQFIESVLQKMCAT